MGIGAVEKDMLLILDVIGITQVTGGGITCRCLKTKRCYNFKQPGSVNFMKESVCVSTIGMDLDLHAVTFSQTVWLIGLRLVLASQH